MRRGGSFPEGTAIRKLDLALAWELLYRLEPELYDRLVSAERLHPDVLGWLPTRSSGSSKSARARVG